MTWMSSLKQPFQPAGVETGTVCSPEIWTQLPLEEVREPGSPVWGENCSQSPVVLSTLCCLCLAPL